MQQISGIALNDRTHFPLIQSHVQWISPIDKNRQVTSSAETIISSIRITSIWSESSFAVTIEQAVLDLEPNTCWVIWEALRNLAKKTSTWQLTLENRPLLVAEDILTNQTLGPNLQMTNFPMVLIHNSFKEASVTLVMHKKTMSMLSLQPIFQQ